MYIFDYQKNDEDRKYPTTMTTRMAEAFIAEMKMAWDSDWTTGQTAPQVESGVWDRIIESAELPSMKNSVIVQELSSFQAKLVHLGILDRADGTDQQKLKSALMRGYAEWFEMHWGPVPI